jgi:hypothetical protein
LDKNTEGKKNREQLKRSPGQINEGTPRPNRTPVSKSTTYAWLPSNHKNPQNFRRILWTKHNLSAPKRSGEKRIRKKRMEYGQRTAKESVQVNNQRTKLVKLHRGFTQLHMQKDEYASDVERRLDRGADYATSPAFTPKKNGTAQNNDLASKSSASFSINKSKNCPA